MKGVTMNNERYFQLIAGQNIVDFFLMQAFQYLIVYKYFLKKEKSFGGNDMKIKINTLSSLMKIAYH